MHDFRSFTRLLEERGDLVRIRRPVDSRVELAAVMSRLETEGRAFIFENVSGAKFPLTGGLFNRVARFGLALGQAAPDRFGHEEMDRLLEEAKAAPIAPTSLPTGPVKEVIHTGAAIRLSDLPVPPNAEFVIEGKVDFSRKIENLMGEFAGQYGPETAPVTRVIAMSHRRDAVFYSIMAGKNPEHNNLGTIATYGIKRDLTARLMQLAPAVRRVNVFAESRLGSMLHV